jgi:putative ABC transport system substrate-binding protein
MRRIGALLNYAAEDPAGQSGLTAFLQGLGQLGWSEGVNARIDIRWGGDAERTRKHAAELIALALDVILTTGSPATGPVLQMTRTVPIVFVQAADPVGAGFVNSLAHPGGNATGFSNFEFGMGGKWLELLKEISPGLKRAAVVRNLTTAAGAGQFGAIQAVAPSLGVEVSPINIHEARQDEAEIERAVSAFARASNGGLIVTGGSVINRRDLIIALAARYKLPAVYPTRYFVTGGGLISYGPDWIDQYRKAAGYVDRILKGEKPADLPVQAPTKYELVINPRTARERPKVSCHLRGLLRSCGNSPRTYPRSIRYRPGRRRCPSRPWEGPWRVFRPGPGQDRFGASTCLRWSPVCASVVDPRVRSSAFDPRPRIEA